MIDRNRSTAPAHANILPAGVGIVVSLAVCAACLASPAVAWTVPDIALAAEAKHPRVACTPEELQRLQAAYRSSGPEGKIVAAKIAAANERLAKPLVFPARGGQHNQWYQCDKCQVALQTVDGSHHRCPRCKLVYTGEPYDDVLFSRVHNRNLNDMETAAWAYAITGDEKYAAFAARVLLGYAQRYEQYPYHTANRNPLSRSGGHLFEQTLNEASAMAGTIAPAYDLIHNASSLSADDHRAIRQGLLLPMLRNIARNKAGKSNWQTWHNAALLWGGAVLGDVDWVRTAIAEPRNGFAYQMSVSVTDDGMWYENSWGYHFYTLQAMVAIVEGARRLDIDLWGHPSLKKMFLTPVEYAMPDGSLPRFGDDVQTTVSVASRMLEYAYHAYGEASMAPYLPTRPSWESIVLGRATGEPPAPPPLTSKVFPGAGHAILRTSGDAGLAAAITFGPYGGFHGHFDKLSFVCFGYGQELGVDPGRAKSQAYRLPIHSRWYKATVGHNTVLVDRKSQEPAAGKLLAFAANGQHAGVAVSCDGAYPGVEHRRLLCLTPSYVLVLDDVRADQPHQFDWLYHNRGSEVNCDSAVEDTAPVSFPGSEYIEHVRVRKGGAYAAQDDPPVRVDFIDRDLTTHLVIAAPEAAELRIADGVGESIDDRVPLAMISHRGERLQMAAVLEPVQQGKLPSVTALHVERAGEAVRVTVACDGHRDIVTLQREGAFVVVRDDQPLLSSTRDHTHAKD